MPNLMHFFLAGARNTVYVLKIHKNEKKEVVIVLDLLAKIVCGRKDVLV